jgi:hypothetical protein
LLKTTEDKDEAIMDILAFKKVISRRSLLKGAPLVVATAVSRGCLTPGEARAQQLKMSQALSKYQDTPKNGQQCSTCSHFVAPSSCAIVVDPIVAQGWCQFYAKLATP